MKIVLITQEDPFYLPEAINEFITKIKLSKKHEIATVIVSSASPFGKKEGFIKKLHKTYQVFGIIFFLYYSCRYIYNKILIRKTVSKVVWEHNIPIWRLKDSINNKQSIVRLKNINPDVIVIIAGNQIIKKQILDIPKYGVINAHSSLLPHYKGLMPTFWVMKNNELETGVTVYKLTEGIDDGPIIISKSISIDPKATQADLIVRCKKLANDLLIDALELIIKPEVFRSNNGGSYYRFPTKEDVQEFYKLGKKFY